MQKGRNAHIILADKPFAKRLLQRSRRWEENIKMDRSKIENDLEVGATIS
jgi:hypothetical protein